MGPEPIENIKASFNADARCEESLTLTHVGEKFLFLHVCKRCNIPASWHSLFISWYSAKAQDICHILQIRLIPVDSSDHTKFLLQYSSFFSRESPMTEALSEMIIKLKTENS